MGDYFGYPTAHNKKQISLQVCQPFVDVVDVSPRVEVSSRLLLEIVVLLPLVRMCTYIYIYIYMCVCALLLRIIDEHACDEIVSMSLNALSRTRMSVHSRKKSTNMCLVLVLSL